MGKQWKELETLFSWVPKSLQMVTATMKLKDACSLEENLNSILKSRDITLPTKVRLVKAMVFPAVMHGCWELDCKESWAPKNDAFELWCWRRLESPLDCKEIQPVNPKGHQFWIFIGRPDDEAEALILLATWCEELTHWKRPWCWERLKALGEGDDREWDGWMASPMRWTLSLSKLQVLVMDWEAWHASVRNVAKSWIHWPTELNWTDLPLGLAR